MKWRALGNDPDVKPFWKKTMNNLWWICLVMAIVRGILRIKNKTQQTESVLTDWVNWIFVVFVLLWIIPMVMYWIAPGLFRQRKVS